MQARIGPVGGLGPVTLPITTEPGVKGTPDLVPVIQCGVNAQGRRFVTIWVRNGGAEAAPRLFVAEYLISGRGFIFGQVPISSLRPGQAVRLEATDDNILQGNQRIIITVDADRLKQIPEDLNQSNNRMVVRCFPMPIVQGAMGPMM